MPVRTRSQHRAVEEQRRALDGHIFAGRWDQAEEFLQLGIETSTITLRYWTEQGIRNNYPISFLKTIYLQYCLSLNVLQRYNYHGRIVYDAAYHGRVDFLRWLIEERHLSVNTEEEVCVPLIFAHRDCIELLLKAGADVHMKNGYGHTALARHIISTPESSSISLLLQYGSDPYMKNKDGITAIAYSLRYAPRYHSVLQRAGILPIMLSALMIPRVGERSPLRVLSTDIVRLVGGCL